MTSSVLSLLSPLSEILLSNVADSVTLCSSPALFSAVVDVLRPKIEAEAPNCLSSLIEATGNADTVVPGWVPRGTCENVKPMLLPAEAWEVSAFSGLDESKPDEETVLDTDGNGIGRSLTGDPISFSFNKFVSTFFSNIFCSTFCSFLFESNFCSVFSISILFNEFLDGMGTSRSSSNSGNSSNTVILKPGFCDVAAEFEFPKMVLLSGEATFDGPSFNSFSLSFFNREPFKSGPRGPLVPSKS
uniref:Uncharacterized protein n=1 Tax=Arundo donax TaxID=35708 RepID=A0A0A9ESG3_ARUDO